MLWCILNIAHKLHKSEDEIAGWPLKRLVRWMAYFKIVQEEETRAINRARVKAGLPAL